MLRATVSGSFHRHMMAIYNAVGDLRFRGVDVLSPADPRVVDFIGDFLFVASDKLRSIKLVQDRHLEAIRASDFLLVVCPDGYTGPSTSMEIGAAVAAKVPVFSTASPADITLREYVDARDNDLDKIVSRVAETAGRRARVPTHILLDPETTILESLHTLESLRPQLSGTTGDGKGDAEKSLQNARNSFAASFGLR